MNTEDFKDLVYLKDDNGLVTLTLNTPARKNALSPVSFLEIYWAIDQFEKDEAAHALIITGAKTSGSDDPTREAFSSGGYFSPDAFEGVSDELMRQIDLTDIAQKKATLKLFLCDKPIIAAINGLAIGGGFTFVLAGADKFICPNTPGFNCPLPNWGFRQSSAPPFYYPGF